MGSDEQDRCTEMMTVVLRSSTSVYASGCTNTQKPMFWVSGFFLFFAMKMKRGGFAWLMPLTCLPAYAVVCDSCSSCGVGCVQPILGRSAIALIRKYNTVKL